MLWSHLPQTRAGSRDLQGIGGWKRVSGSNPDPLITLSLSRHWPRALPKRFEGRFFCLSLLLFPACGFIISQTKCAWRINQKVKRPWEAHRGKALYGNLEVSWEQSRWCDSLSFRFKRWDLTSNSNSKTVQIQNNSNCSHRGSIMSRIHWDDFSVSNASILRLSINILGTSEWDPQKPGMNLQTQTVRVRTIQETTGNNVVKDMEDQEWNDSIPKPGVLNPWCTTVK